MMYSVYVNKFSNIPIACHTPLFSATVVKMKTFSNEKQGNKYSYRDKCIAIC